MISSFSLCSIRVAGLAYPATKKELVVYSTYPFYQDFIFLSNTYTPFKNRNTFFQITYSRYPLTEKDKNLFRSLS